MNELEKEVETEITEHTFSTTLFSQIDVYNKEIRDHEMQIQKLAGIYQDMIAAKESGDYVVKFYQTDTGVRYILSERKCGF